MLVVYSSAKMMRTLPRLPTKAIFIWALLATFLCSILLLGRSTLFGHSSRSSSFSSSSAVSWVPLSGGDKKPPKKTYVGNTGQFVFYHLKARNYSVDPETMKLCKETSLTQCNPPAVRSQAERVKDRAKRPPFKFALLRRPPFLSGDPSFEHCQYDNCRFIGPSPDYAKEADAFFVYVVGMKDREFDVPKERRANQTYIMGSWEAPIFTAADFLSNPRSQWNSAFNATSTYRLDSDIVYGYGKLDFQPPPPDRKPDYLQIARNKTKTAVWVVSNCGSPSKRNEYVKEMQVGQHGVETNMKEMQVGQHGVEMKM
ncbi:hypothetical protein RRG08_021236 [Elysia crispata]|uniref:Fucosyltransferase N-terminal domain-containing protein n=1 Tax=Elysia crispata TaxID=231223 RepID=A0AAE0YXW2_9GAST|nr:hypothetical protein RRG08_021236 [Elysia crispata]